MNIKDYLFRALMPSMFNARVITMCFREVWEALKSIEARLDVLDGGNVAESVATEPVVEVEPVIVEPEEKAFDWKTSEDAKAMKDFALSEFGLGIKGNKKAATIRKEIEGFLSV